MRKNELKPFYSKILSMYRDNKMSAKEVSVVIGCSDSAVYKVLRFYHEDSRSKREAGTRYSLTPNTFQKIDTEEKAYFLGLLYADGYHNEKDNSVVIRLQERDSYILETFNKYLGSNRPLGLVECMGKMKQRQKRLSITNKEFSSDLSRLGLKQAKSLTCEFPTPNQVPDHLVHHFIRGYFDGDGCIHLRNDDPRYATIVICVSKPFGDRMLSVIAKHGINLKYRKQQSKIHNLHMSGRIQCLQFMDLMYKDATVFLSRKREKYDIMKAYVPSGTSRTSQYYGVGREGNRWKATCRNKGVNHYLGIFKEEIDAAKRFDIFVLENKIPKKGINFPEGTGFIPSGFQTPVPASVEYRSDV